MLLELCDLQLKVKLAEFLDVSEKVTDECEAHHPLADGGGKVYCIAL